MRITKAADYSVRALIYLASRDPGEPADVNEIARAMDVPRSYLVKVLNNLGRAAFVKSHRGVGGGFTLSMEPDDVNLRMVVEAVDGPIALNACLDPAGCGRSGSCGIFGAWVDVQEKLIEVMESYTLSDLSAPFPGLRRKKKKTTAKEKR